MAVDIADPEITARRRASSEEVRAALDVGPGDKLTWQINGGKVVLTTERPAFYRWEGFIKEGPTDVVKVIKEARKRRGRI